MRFGWTKLQSQLGASWLGLPLPCCKPRAPYSISIYIYIYNINMCVCVIVITYAEERAIKNCEYMMQII